MNKLIRLFNQNIKKIITGVLAIGFVLLVINVLNSTEKENNEKARNAIENNTIVSSNNSKNNTNNYDKESTSLISGEKVSDQYQDTFAKLIDNFLKACTEGNYEKAYNMLSEDCKDEIYPSSNSFVDKYCKNKFVGNRKYSFQSWTAKEPYIYKIKIFEDMLSSGKANTEYIEDYYTIVEQDGEYKLNISSFIGTSNKNIENTTNGLKIKIKKIKVYLNYLIYDMQVENTTENTICLDRRKATNETFLVDKSGATYYALLHENKQNDLIIGPENKKEFEIKFSCVYQENTSIEGLVFSKVIPNHEVYKQNTKEYKDFYQVEIEQ